MNTLRTNLLSDNPDLEHRAALQLREDFDRFARDGLPGTLDQYLLDAYRLDLSTTYAGIPVKNPWGKASGQLSMTTQQVSEDAQAGLGFCVLKTVIAEDVAGEQSMRAWAIPESRMVLERIRGAGGDDGWTVSWRGRGWSRPFAEYLAFVTQAREIGDQSGMLVVPSCKFHLPTPADPNWRIGEYEYTSRRLCEAYDAAARSVTTPMALEKDFSPTLAGSGLAAERSQVLDWLRMIPRLVRTAIGADRVRVGLKLFNALFDDAFQLEMLRVASAPGPDRPDFLVYANRLFDPAREFDSQRGIAVGGPDLSARNLRILGEFSSHSRQSGAFLPIEISATGNICSGKLAVEYLLRGCSSFQIHIYFQLLPTEYHMRQGGKIVKALHMLLFDPETGFIGWMLHLSRRAGVPNGSIIRMRDFVGRADQQL